MLMITIMVYVIREFDDDDRDGDDGDTELLWI